MNGHRRHLLIVTLLLLAIAPAAPAQEAPAIRLDTVGYLPARPKRATIAVPCSTFRVVSEVDGATAFEGKVSGPARNEDTGEDLYTADFSELRRPGLYRLEAPGAGRSSRFEIARFVTTKPFITVTRGMYLWRCGTAVAGHHDGEEFAHGPCHLDDAWLDVVEGRHARRESTRGWHDAGDYNKYVVNAGVTVGSMLRAWLDFAPMIRQIPLGLPESKGPLPEFLAEIRWEVQWLLTMQAKDGSVLHKVSTKGFGGFVPPEQEKDPRFFVPWSSAATADLVAMTAMTARCFRGQDSDFVDRCLAASKSGYAFLKAHPDDHQADQRRFKTGEYATPDTDDRLWAAAELWEATGDRAVLADLEARIRATDARVDVEWDWSNVGNLGLFTYVFSESPDRDPQLVAKVRANLIAAADAIVKARDAHGYARPLGNRYSWGGNGTVARQVMNLQAAHRLTGNPAYRETALDAIHHLFGRNVFGRSFVTGVGFRPPMHPHDRRSGGDKVEAPWPGYLVGGPHPKATDWKDEQGDYRTNEIAINWNGALIYALAAFLDDPAP